MRGPVLLVGRLTGARRRHHAGDRGHRVEGGEGGQGGEGGGRAGGGGGHHLGALVQQRGHGRRLGRRRQGAVACKQKIKMEIWFCIYFILNKDATVLGILCL